MPIVGRRLVSFLRGTLCGLVLAATVCAPVTLPRFVASDESAGLPAGPVEEEDDPEGSEQTGTASIARTRRSWRRPFSRREPDAVEVADPRVASVPGPCPVRACLPEFTVPRDDDPLSSV